MKKGEILKPDKEFEEEQKRYEKIQRKIEKKDFKALEKMVKSFGEGKEKWWLNIWLLPTTFFTFTTDNVSTTVGYIRDVVSDAMPLIVVILGITIGVWIIKAIFHIGR